MCSRHGVWQRRKTRAQPRCSWQSSTRGSGGGEDFKEDVVYSPGAMAQKQKDEAKKLREQAAELAEEIDALSYSAILGNITTPQMKTEGHNNVLFKAMAGAVTTTRDLQTSTAAPHSPTT
ncbi:hypothetical protein ERJ75_001556000 [Trypanosoma vivax]|nr:hypothetical protein ERJ75_001556000 [Trypanosoma vivax]